jgi:SNF2 family DNA or RNA helicase
MNQYRKLCKYLNNVAKAKSGSVDIKRFERPNLSLFSEILDSQEGVQSPYLVLDEVTAVKNSKSITFAAIEELRKLAHTCVMLTGSPVDNTWFDLFAYVLLLLGHKIRSRPAMLAVFASENAAGKRGPPKGNQMRRLLQLLNSFVVRRPENTITIPALHEQTVSFELSPSEAGNSNYHYDKYMQIVNMKSSKDTVRILNLDKLLPWRHLTQAMQYACHPAMVLIMHLVRNPMGEDNDQELADVLYEAEDIEEWMAWRENLKIDNNWKSSRITAIIDVFNKVRDLDPSSSVIIFDESVYFLDIVEIAFSNMYEPVECLRYDGRTVAEKRSAVLQAFANATGPKVLLASRAAGGAGLNITTANVVILCGPWWKIEWEQQAIKRSHRPGQTREVLAFKMMASNCSLDIYKAAVRDKKHRHNLKIITQITRQDGIVPTAWNNLED